MAWKRVRQHPSEIVNVGTKITVKSMKFDPNVPVYPWARTPGEDRVYR